MSHCSELSQLYQQPFNAVLRPTFIQKLCYKLLCNLYIHTDFWSKFCLLYWTAPCWKVFLKFALFSLSGLKDEKLMKKQTYMKTEAYKLYSRVFWIFQPNFIKVNHYNFELYRFKVCAFFETQCIYNILHYYWCYK